MTAWASALAGLLLAAPSQVLFHFQDAAITESSGLVVSGELVYTVNDSGDWGRVFAVDRRSGETVGVTTYGADVVDVEALAPGPDDTLWVGDIGDNSRERSHVTLYRIAAPGRGERTATPAAFDLVYRDGPRDAEALLVHPRTGRVYVVSKGLLGGTVYAAPRRLRSDRTNVLVPVAGAPGMVTDGAFFPDGRHAVLRDYSGAMVVQAGRFAGLARFSLPDQEQGEGLALDGEWVVVSSEGEHAAVQSKLIPARVLRALGPTSRPIPSPDASPPSTAASDDDPWGGRLLPALLAGGPLVVAGIWASGHLRRRRRAAS